MAEIIRRMDVLWPWYESTKMPDGWAKRMPGEWADMRAENKELRDTVATLAADNAALKAKNEALEERMRIASPSEEERRHQDILWGMEAEDE